MNTQDKLAEALRHRIHNLRLQADISALNGDNAGSVTRRIVAEALERDLQAHAAEAAQAQAHCSEWPSIINEAADVLSDVADMVGGATSKLPSSWRWPLIDELHGAAGQIAAAPQPQAAEPVAEVSRGVRVDGVLLHEGELNWLQNTNRPAPGTKLYTRPPAQAQAQSGEWVGRKRKGHTEWRQGTEKDGGGSTNYVEPVWVWDEPELFDQWMDRDWPLWRNDPDNPNVARLRRMYDMFAAAP